MRARKSALNKLRIAETNPNVRVVSSALHGRYCIHFNHMSWMDLSFLETHHEY